MIKFNLVGDEKQLMIDFRKIAKKVTKAVNNNFAIKTKHVVSFIIVDNDKIHEINKQYRNIDAPTDVITFAMIDGEVEEQLPYELGDIFINWERVKSQAIDYGHSETREFAFLVTHGLLHILGYDHQVKADEEIMFRLQDIILEKVKISR